jgi:hypothetical protein
MKSFFFLHREYLDIYMWFWRCGLVASEQGVVEQ